MAQPEKLAMPLAVMLLWLMALLGLLTWQGARLRRNSR
jgi:hypothetical protein